MVYSSSSSSDSSTSSSSFNLEPTDEELRRIYYQKIEVNEVLEYYYVRDVPGFRYAAEEMVKFAALLDSYQNSPDLDVRIDIIITVGTANILREGAKKITSALDVVNDVLMAMDSDRKDWILNFPRRNNESIPVDVRSSVISFFNRVDDNIWFIRQELSHCLDIVASFRSMHSFVVRLL